MNVLIIMAHPRKDSFSGAIARTYKETAESLGLHVRQLDLVDHEFDLNVITVSPRQQHHERFIIDAQHHIIWADHLVFVYPTWWGAMPALLKGFFDRAFTPGFAFKELEENQSWEKLLKGKSAQLITTMDTPLWVYRWIYKNPGHNAIGKATLEFCGITPVRRLAFSPVKYSTPNQREKWLQRVEKQALKLRNGLMSPWEEAISRLKTWIRAIRLQFYPMTGIAYAAGAFAASTVSNGFNHKTFWIGYLWLFLLEMSTVFSNDYYDYDTDRQNKFFSPFTGGSRVLVDNSIKPAALLRAVWLSLGASVIIAVSLMLLLKAHSISTGTLMLLMYILALGYTIPPLKLSYRGWGELDVAITHSFGVILCGFHFQGGYILNAIPWFLSLPLFFAIFPSIILAGIPDYDADKAIGKKTLAVRLGPRQAVALAMGFTIVSAIVALIFSIIIPTPRSTGLVLFAIVFHATYLLVSTVVREQSKLNN